MVFPQQQWGGSVAACIWALPLQGWPLFWMNGWKETWMSLESLEHSWDWGWRKCSVDLDEKCWIQMKRDRMTVYNIFWIVVFVIYSHCFPFPAKYTEMRLIYYYLGQFKVGSICKITNNEAVVNPWLNRFHCFNLLQWSPDHLPSIHSLFPRRRRPLCNWLFRHGGWRHLLFPRRLPLPIYPVVGEVPASDSAPCVWPGFFAAEGPGGVSTKRFELIICESYI